MAGSSLVQYGNSPNTGKALVHTVQSVGDFTALYENSILGLAVEGMTSVYLTGFKLESMIVSSDQQMDNARVVPLVNGDTITLTNICKAGTLTFTCARTSAGVSGGDAVTIFDFVRSQGDNGGTLTFAWKEGTATHTIVFDKVCVKRVQAIAIAGNDVPDYQVQLTYADYDDDGSPSHPTESGGGEAGGGEAGGGEAGGS